MANSLIVIAALAPVRAASTARTVRWPALGSHSMLPARDAIA